MSRTICLDNLSKHLFKRLIPDQQCQSTENRIKLETVTIVQPMQNQQHAHIHPNLYREKGKGGDGKQREGEEE